MFRIRVEGCLGPEWSDRLAGLSVVVWEAQGRPAVSELSGRLVDDAALMGALVQLYNLGVPILSVERVATD